MKGLPGIQSNHAHHSQKTPCDPLTSKAWVGPGGGEGFLFRVTPSRIPSRWDASGDVPDIPAHCRVSPHTQTRYVQLNAPLRFSPTVTANHQRVRRLPAFTASIHHRGVTGLIICIYEQDSGSVTAEVITEGCHMLILKVAPP